MAGKVECSIAGGIARLVIANEARSNALDAAIFRGLADVTAAIRTDANVKVVLLSARGENFGVGGDINEFVAARDHIRREVLSLASSFHTAVTHLRQMAAPVVAAASGIAAGGSFDLLLACDMVVAKRSAKFCAAYTRSGLTPDGGGTYFLPRIVGLQRAFDIFATNPTFSAEQAQALGLVARVIDDDKFDADVEVLMQNLAASPPGVLAALKRLLHASVASSLETQLAHEADSISTMAATPSTLERLAAFLAKKDKA